MSSIVNVLSVENLTKSYGEKYLFQDVTFGIARGQKVALVARNGSGKTTLLNILMGLEAPDSGTITWRRNVNSCFLVQDPVFPPETTAIEALFLADDPVQNAIRAYETALVLNETDPSPENQEKFSIALELMDSHDAWDFEARVKEILGKLNITRLTQRTGEMSGGQRKRLALAQALIREPEFLILDEPTNHLDYEMIEWLEEYLSGTNLSILLVTHDRYFLDRICDLILELDEETLFPYHGNYEYYLEKREERAFKKASEQEKARNLFRKELDWIRRQPKARGTKAKARVDSFQVLEEKVKNKRTEDDLTLSVKMTRIGSKILDMKKVSKKYGELTILKGFSYTFKRGERIGIVGKNGVGKSTFLNMLMGLCEIDNGKIELGETIVPGYFSQDGLKYKDNQRVIDVIKEIAEVIILSDSSKVSASQFLQLFQFDYYKQQTPVDKLSGGEKRRLHLSTVLMKNPNLLILDEPTNDLDLITLNILEEFLMFYPGCLVVVTHDRYFLDKLVDHLLIFAGDGEVYDYNGSYRQWREEQLAKEKALRDVPKVTIKPTKQDRQENITDNKLSFQERKEFSRLEKEIENLETQRQSLENQISEATDLERITKISKQIQETIQSIDEKTERWLELSEKN